MIRAETRRPLTLRWAPPESNPEYGGLALDEGMAITTNNTVSPRKPSLARNIYLARLQRLGETGQANSTDSTDATGKVSVTKEDIERLIRARDLILQIGERAITVRQIETGVWDVMRQRETARNSMVPELEIKAIRVLIQSAVERVHVRLENEFGEHRRTRAKLKESRNQIKELKKRYIVTEERIKALERRLKSPKDTSQNKAIKTGRVRNPNPKLGSLPVVKSNE